MFEMDEHDLQAIQRDTHKIYREFLDPSGKGYVTREEIKALSQDTLKEIARRTEPPHGPVAGASDDRGGAYKASLEKDADQNEQEIEVEGRDEL